MDEAKHIEEEYRAAQEKALDAVQKLFPVGCIVRVSDSWIMRVERHGCSWHDPLTVYGVNTETGKNRRFYVGHDEAQRIRTA